MVSSMNGATSTATIASCMPARSTTSDAPVLTSRDSVVAMKAPHRKHRIRARTGSGPYRSSQRKHDTSTGTGSTAAAKPMISASRPIRKPRNTVSPMANSAMTPITPPSSSPRRNPPRWPGGGIGGTDPGATASDGTASGGTDPGESGCGATDSDGADSDGSGCGGPETDTPDAGGCSTMWPA